MKPIALPTAIVHALRHPTLEAADFTATKFCPAANKAWFASHYMRFVSSDFPKHQFTQRFYAQLMHCHGHIAHFNLFGFWTEFFTSITGKIEFIEQTISYPCYGAPSVTWSDAEREIIRRLRQANLLDYYRHQLAVEQEAADRAELARLLAKYGEDAPAVDPGTLHTVLVPMNRQVPARSAPRRDGDSQLTLGLG